MKRSAKTISEKKLTIILLSIIASVVVIAVLRFVLLILHSLFLRTYFGCRYSLSCLCGFILCFKNNCNDHPCN